MQKITTFLWFNGNAEAAADFYVSIFKDSKVLSTMGPKGQAMGVTFQFEGQEFIGLNGGPKYSFTPAISLFVNCDTQAEVDELWGGKLLGDKDRAKADRVMHAMMQMKKIDIAKLKQAYEG